MFCLNRAVARIPGLGFVLGVSLLLGQPPPRRLDPSVALEMPVVMRQNIVAGRTEVGTAIQAKLTVATLVNGTVIPKGAILWGEVAESLAKSANAPSRLSVVVKSAQWKDGSKPQIFNFPSTLYLTAWYYPVNGPTLTEDIPEDPPSPRRRNSQHIGGSASYPNPNTSDSPGYSKGSASEAKPSGRSAPPAAPLHRVLMKNMEAARGSDESIAITCARSDIKLDKSTTYVLATGSLLSLSK
jgi:hypothetical protein